jgi:hypothetical protein
LIEFTREAMEFIQEKKIEAIYLTLKYVQGPCSDNLCKMIPRVIVSIDKDPNYSFMQLEENFVKVFAIPPIASSISRHKDAVIIKKTRLGKGLYASGVTYSF